MSTSDLKKQEKQLFRAFYTANYHGDKATMKTVLKELEQCLYAQRKTVH